MSTYISSASLITPIGIGISENFTSLKNNISGIKLYNNVGFNGESLYLSKINSIKKDRFYNILDLGCKELKKNYDRKILVSSKTLIIISTTKADIDIFPNNPFSEIENFLKKELEIRQSPLIISNACISGVVAINHGVNLVNSKQFDTIIVIGIDTVSDFVLFGFQSLYAVSDQPTQPYDAARKGINLGEGLGIVVISNEKLNSNFHALILSGTSSNDANHISGPSRTGEGLVRTINKTFNKSKIYHSEIDYISAHGTGTIFNDEMESIALDRLQLSQKPVNSFKGYFGHTLGAAGVIETICCILSLENNILFKSIGYNTSGVSKELNVITENTTSEINVILKTASGFGGGNASLILKKQ
jgi:3-oxoacyl-[acyl-carrier-protein] synthase-1